MATKLTHIAISAVNPPLMREFYTGVFGLTSVSNRGGFLTDGYVNFALNYRKPGYQAGLDHFGFEVEDIEEVRERLADLYPAVGVTTRPAHRGYVGYAAHDPEGHVFDLSYAGMGEQRRVVNSIVSGRTTRHFHHLAMRCMNPEAMAQFYVDALGLEWAREPQESDTTFHLTDGVIILVCMPWIITDFAEAGIVERPALDHMGFEVESIPAYKKDLAALVERNAEAAPWADSRDEQRLRDERAAREDLLSKCEYNMSQLWDPECVFFDVRERADV